MTRKCSSHLRVVVQWIARSAHDCEVLSSIPPFSENLPRLKTQVLSHLEKKMKRIVTELCQTDLNHQSRDKKNITSSNKQTRAWLSDIFNSSALSCFTLKNIVVTDEAFKNWQPDSLLVLRPRENEFGELNFFSRQKLAPKVDSLIIL